MRNHYANILGELPCKACTFPEPREKPPRKASQGLFKSGALRRRNLVKAYHGESLLRNLAVHGHALRSRRRHELWPTEVRAPSVAAKRGIMGRKRAGHPQRAHSSTVRSVQEFPIPAETSFFEGRRSPAHVGRNAGFPTRTTRARKPGNNASFPLILRHQARTGNQHCLRHRGITASVTFRAGHGTVPHQARSSCAAAPAEDKPPRAELGLSGQDTETAGQQRLSVTAANAKRAVAESLQVMSG